MASALLLLGRLADLSPRKLSEIPGGGFAHGSQHRSLVMSFPMFGLRKDPNGRRLL